MYATLTAVAITLAAAQPPATAPGAGQPGRPGQPGAAPGVGAQPSVDGTWTIVVLEKNGRPVADAAKHMTVSIRGNVVTFNRAGTAGSPGAAQPESTQPRTGGVAGASSDMRSMRVEFGPNGTVRVTEADGAGKFGEPLAPGTTPAAAPGTAPGSGPGLGSQSGVRTGVYVLTQDYLAVCVHDTGTGLGQPGTTSLDRPGTTGTTRPGTDRPGTDRPGAGRPNDRPGAGQDRPGAGSDRPAAGAAAQPGGTSGIGDGRLPAQRSYVTVILRRDTGSRPAAAAAAR